MHVHSLLNKMSIDMPHWPSLDTIIRPAPEFVDNEGHPLAYVEITYKEFLELQQSGRLSYKFQLDFEQISKGACARWLLWRNWSPNIVFDNKSSAKIYYHSQKLFILFFFFLMNYSQKLVWIWTLIIMVINRMTIFLYISRNFSLRTYYV